MKVESAINFKEALRGLSGERGDLVYHNGTSWVRLTGASRGSILFRGASGWSFLTPGAAGAVVQTGGAGADPSYSAPSTAIGDPMALESVYTPSASYMPMVGVNAYQLTGSTASLTSQYLYCWPWLCPEDVSFSAVAVQVGTTVASSGVKILVFEDTGSGYPGDLMLTSGAITTASTGVQSVAVSWDLVAGTLYWPAVFVSAHTGATLLQTRPAGCLHLGATSLPTTINSQETNGIYLKTTGLTYASPPSVFPSTPTITDQPPFYVAGYVS